MDKCAICGAETELYYSGVAVCLECSRTRDQALDQAEWPKIPDPRPFRMSQFPK
jgi:hypothetical protein